MYYFTIFSNWMPIVDWCVIRWGSKNKHHINTCSKEIGLSLETLLKYSTLSREHEHLSTMQLRNQQTCTSKNHNNFIFSNPMSNSEHVYAFIIDFQSNTSFICVKLTQKGKLNNNKRWTEFTLTCFKFIACFIS